MRATIVRMPTVALAGLLPRICLVPVLPRRKLHFSRRTGLENLSKGNYAACLGSEHYRTAIESKTLVPHEGDDSLQIGAMSIVLIPDYKRKVRDTRNGTMRGMWKLGHGWGVKSKQIKDGTSRTIVLSEVLSWDGESQDARFSEDVRGACGRVQPWEPVPILTSSVQTHPCLIALTVARVTFHGPPHVLRTSGRRRR